MVTELATKDTSAIMEQVAIGGDLAALTAGQRVNHYLGVCDSLKLNPLTKPFQYIRLNNKLTLYATRDCTDQLRSRDAISIVLTDKQTMGEIYLVSARATNAAGRQDESTGAVPVKGLAGEGLANAMMKAETKAKRRVTLSICGLGIVDESEVGSIPDARPVSVDTTTGEIVDGTVIEENPEKLSEMQYAMIKELCKQKEVDEQAAKAIVDAGMKKGYGPTTMTKADATAIIDALKSVPDEQPAAEAPADKTPISPYVDGPNPDDQADPVEDDPQEWQAALTQAQELCQIVFGANGVAMKIAQTNAVGNKNPMPDLTLAELQAWIVNLKERKAKGQTGAQKSAG